MVRLFLISKMEISEQNIGSITEKSIRKKAGVSMKKVN